MRNKFNNSTIQQLNNKGFTLVELLIVIVIIGILSAILLANFVGVRQRARDAQRKSDLRQIQSALELYRSDVGSYPAGVSYALVANCPGPNQLTNPNDSAVVYMQKIPCNPLGKGGYLDPVNGNYYYDSTGGTTYNIATCLENKQDLDPNASSAPSNQCDSLRKYLLSQP